MVKSVYGRRATEKRPSRVLSSTHIFQVAEDIMPIAELKAHLSETVRGLDDRVRPLVITLNGKPAAVVMSPREYDRLTERARLLDAVHEGLADVKAGRTISDAELGRHLDKRYGKLARKR